jgi:hypothetical protein
MNGGTAAVVLDVVGVACSHDAKRRVSMESATAVSMPTRGFAA